MADSLRNELDPALRNTRSSAEQMKTSWESFDRAMKDTNALKSRLGYFFSLTNSV
jgi:hypothetical protein